MDAVAYAHAVTSVALFTMLVLALDGYSGYLKGQAKLPAGAAPTADYADPIYRAHRAFQNGVENLAAFAAAVLAAMMAGAAPFWINLFASIAVVVRLAMAFVHLRGIGAEVGGPRSILFSVQWGLTFLIAVLAFVAGFVS